MKLIMVFLILISEILTKDLRKVDLYNRILHETEIQTPSELNQNSSQLLRNVLVQADFGEAYYAKSNNSLSSNETFLAIIISSNETGLLNYYTLPQSIFVCDSAYCTEDEDDSIFEFSSSWISATTKRIHLNTTISIAGGAWRLKTSALHYNSTGFNKIQGVMYGWIGLGTGSEAHKNFQTKNPIFSLLINETHLNAGSLIFGFDSTIADIDNPLLTISSDANWKLQMTSLSFGSTVYSDTDQTIPIMFDLVRDGIVFPKDIRDSLINQVITYNLTCFGSACVADNLSGLPSLIFGLADGKNFSLMPHQYMKSADYDIEGYNYLSLSLRKIPTIPYSYEDSIILGWDVLANFYTLFQQVDGINIISFYEINSATSNKTSITPPEWSSSELMKTGVIVMIVMVCVGAVIYITRKKKSMREIETMELSKVEASDAASDSQEQSHFI